MTDNQLEKEIARLQTELEAYKNMHYKLQYKGEELTASEVGKRLDKLEQIKADRDTYKKLVYDIFSRPDCNDCKKIKCEYAPKIGERTRINCPLWQGEAEREKGCEFCNAEYAVMSVKNDI